MADHRSHVEIVPIWKARRVHAASNESKNQEPRAPQVTALSAVTLITRDLPRSLAFYRALGFELRHGDATSRLVSLAAGNSYLNLLSDPDGEPVSSWGRVILHVSDVDAFYRRALEQQVAVEAPPRDAEWGERFFHARDPDGHELSFAKPLA